jgi:CBS domain containing-hemolysin-like protein
MKEKAKSKSKDHSWIVFISITTFILSLTFSFISNTAIASLDVIPSILVLIIVILIGVIFDLIGVAVTVANEEDFHAQASKKIKGAKTSIKMIRNSAKVSNFCADVVGDICGVLSGAISAMIALEVTEAYGMSSSIQFVFSAIVASITVGGKAFTKQIAKNYSTQIVSFVSKIISFKDKK